jgi:hypothetical protein
MSFPTNFQSFDSLGKYLKYYLNNHGNPHEKADYNEMRSRDIEASVLDYFADLFSLTHRMG